MMTVHNTIASLSLLAFVTSTTSAQALTAYNADPSSVSVSGLSAGGFMAAELGVAYSNVFKTGFGIFAGGPYDCARNQQYTTCMSNNSPSITQPTQNMRTWFGNQIVNTVNLDLRRIYLHASTTDQVVGINPMKQLQSQLANFADPSNVTFVTTQGAAHVFPTDFAGAGNNACGLSASPYITNCGYDGAGSVLKWIYVSGQ